MKGFDGLEFIISVLQFLMDIRCLSWTVAIGTPLWILYRKYVGVVGYYRLSIFLCGLTMLMGLAEVIFLGAWFIFFQKDDLGLPYATSLLGSLPIVIPALIVVFCFRHDRDSVHKSYLTNI